MRTDLMIRSPSGRYVTARKEDILRAYAVVTADALPRGSVMDAPSAVRRYLIDAYTHREAEVFGVMLLDNRHRLIRVQEVFYGTIDGASVHPREVVKLALESNTAAMLIFHNHPSGVPEPSQADELITHRLKDALSLVDVRLLDHIVIGGGKYVSLAERGII